MSLYLDDGDVRLYHGDALTVLQDMPAESVHMCVTSPPFYGLRDYGVDGQIGLEETPEQWVASLVQVFREVRRVLRDDGTLWLEVGDSYASSPAGNKGERRIGDGGAIHENKPDTSRCGIAPKDLIGAPWMLAFALRADGWWLRSDIVWARPNPMPESVTDRPTKSHSYVFLLAKQPRYYWDAEAVREKDGGRPSGNGYVRDHRLSYQNPDGTGRGQEEQWLPGGGRNIRSVWTIATQPFPDAHFATFPEELARRCILAGTSEQGCCQECGAPWVRDVEKTPITKPTYRENIGYSVSGGGDRDTISRFGDGVTTQTLGWEPTCGHYQTLLRPPVPCVVLDPFVGSGTVPFVARKHGRHAIGIDLSASYLELAARRLQQLSLFA